MRYMDYRIYGSANILFLNAGNRNGIFISKDFYFVPQYENPIIIKIPIQTFYKLSELGFVGFKDNRIIGISRKMSPQINLF